MQFDYTLFNKKISCKNHMEEKTTPINIKPPGCHGSMFFYLARLLCGAVLCVFLISSLCLSQEQEKFQSVQVGGFALGVCLPHWPHKKVSVSYFRSF